MANFCVSSPPATKNSTPTRSNAFLSLVLVWYPRHRSNAQRTHSARPRPPLLPSLLVLLYTFFCFSATHHKIDLRTLHEDEKCAWISTGEPGASARSPPALRPAPGRTLGQPSHVGQPSRKLGQPSQVGQPRLTWDVPSGWAVPVRWDVPRKPGPAQFFPGC